MALLLQYEDDAITTLASALASGGGTATVVDGSVFPAAAGTDDYFYATIRRASDGAKETVKCSGVAGNVMTLSARAQGSGEVALDFVGGDSVSLRVGTNLVADLVSERKYIEVLSISDLAGVVGVADYQVWVAGYASAGDGGQGTFYWSGSDLSTEVALDPKHGIYVPPTGEDGSNGAWVRIVPGGEYNVCWFGWEPSSTSGGASAQDTIFSAILTFIARGDTSDNGQFQDPTQGNGIYFPALEDAKYYKVACTSGSFTVLHDNLAMRFDDGVTLIKDSSNSNGYPLLKIGNNDLDADGFRVDANSTSVTSFRFVGNGHLRCEDYQNQTGTVDDCVVFVDDCNTMDWGTISIVAGVSARSNGTIGGVIVRRTQHMYGQKLSIVQMTNYCLMFDSRDDATGHIDIQALRLSLRGDNSNAPDSDKSACLVIHGYSGGASVINEFNLGSLHCLEVSGATTLNRDSRGIYLEQYTTPAALGTPSPKGSVVNSLHIGHLFGEGLYTMIDNNSTASMVCVDSFTSYPGGKRRRMVYNHASGRGDFRCGQFVYTNRVAGSEGASGTYLIEWDGGLHIDSGNQYASAPALAQFALIDRTKATFGQREWSCDSSEIWVAPNYFPEVDVGDFGSGAPTSTLTPYSEQVRFINPITANHTVEPEMTGYTWHDGQWFEIINNNATGSETITFNLQNDADSTVDTVVSTTAGEVIKAWYSVDEGRWFGVLLGP